MIVRWPRLGAAPVPQADWPAKLPAIALTLLVASCAPATSQRSQPTTAAPAAAAPGIEWSRAEPISVGLTDFRFEPGRITLHANQPYRLHLQSRGGAHDFAARELFQAASLRADAVGKEAAASGRVELASGEAKDLYLVPLRTGTFPVECTHFLHALFGMTGEVVVQ